MKPPIDPSIVTALAYATLRPFGDPDNEPIETNVEGFAACALEVNELVEDDEKLMGHVLEASESAFSFGLQLGARIGADPAHLPEVKDLIKRYRFEKMEAA